MHGHATSRHFSTPGQPRSDGLHFLLPARVPASFQRPEPAPPDRLGPGARWRPSMRELTALDFIILNFLRDTPRPVRELVEAQPRGSVYRRLKRLQADGWVIKRRHGYTLTAAGQQVQAEQEEAACLGGLGT